MKKNDKVQFKIIPETNEEYTSVTYGCKRFIDNYRFLSSCPGELVKTSDIDNFIILKKEFPDKWNYWTWKLAYAYEYFNSIDNSKKAVDNLKKIFFRKVKNTCLDNEQREQKSVINKLFDIENAKKVTQLCLKSDVFLLSDAFEKLINVKTKDFHTNPL